MSAIISECTDARASYIDMHIYNAMEKYFKCFRREPPVEGWRLIIADILPQHSTSPTYLLSRFGMVGFLSYLSFKIPHAPMM